MSLLRKPASRRRPAAADPPSLASVPPSACAQVFEALIADIVRGTYPPGSRIPAERDLAQAFGASRPTLREALRRLEEWRVVAARRGSGIVVRPLDDWMIDALPSYLRYGGPLVGQGLGAGRIAADVLELRRLTLLDMVRVCLPRLTHHATAELRQRVDETYRLRTDPLAFAQADFATIRAIARAAQSLPTQWLMNRIESVYLEVIRLVAAFIAPSASYHLAWTKVLDRVDAQKFDEAIDALDHYLRNHDRKLLGLLDKPEKTS